MQHIVGRFRIAPSLAGLAPTDLLIQGLLQLPCGGHGLGAQLRTGRQIDKEIPKQQRRPFDQLLAPGPPQAEILLHDPRWNLGAQLPGNIDLALAIAHNRLRPCRRQGHQQLLGIAAAYRLPHVRDIAAIGGSVLHPQKEISSACDFLHAGAIHHLKVLVAIQHLTHVTVTADQGRAVVVIGPHQDPPQPDVGKPNPQYGPHLPLESKIGRQGRQALPHRALALEQPAQDLHRNGDQGPQGREPLAQAQPQGLQGRTGEGHTA